MKTRFYIRKTNKSNLIYFELYLTNTKKRIRVSTKQKIFSIKDWDEKKEKIKNLSNTTNSIEINQFLLEKKASILKRILVLQANEKTENKIEQIILEEFGLLKQVEKTHTDIVSYFEYYIDYFSKNNSISTKKPLTKGTLKTMRNSMERLKDFIAYKKIKKLDFHDFNSKTYDELVNYLKSRNYSINYIGTILNKLKTILKASHEEGIHNNSDYQKKFYNKLYEDVDHIYLNKDELLKIYNLQLEDELLENVRDIFIIGCQTGLRVGDLTSFLKSPKIIIKDNREFIKIEQSKTSSEVIIPLNSMVKNILNKRNGNFPKYVHKSIINREIKRVCKRAEINELVEIKITKGFTRETITKPKYKFVSSHTCRRSFCSNAYREGIPVHFIMAISGHKSEATFYNYVKVKQQDKASKIAEFDFFK